MAITTCLLCGRLFDTTEEEANAPNRLCTPCYHQGHRLDDFGNHVSRSSEPDYGGVFDGYHVTSDADPGP